MNHTTRALVAHTVDRFDTEIMIYSPFPEDMDQIVAQRHAANMLALRLSSPSLHEHIAHNLDSLAAGEARTPFPSLIPDDDEKFSVSFIPVILDLENLDADPTFLGGEWFVDMTFADMTPGGSAGIAELRQAVWASMNQEG